MKTFKELIQEIKHISAVPNSRGEYEKVNRPSSINIPKQQSVDQLQVGKKYRNKKIGTVHAEITEIGKNHILANRVNKNGETLQSDLRYTHKEFLKTHEI